MRDRRPGSRGRSAQDLPRPLLSAHRTPSHACGDFLRLLLRRILPARSPDLLPDACGLACARFGSLGGGAPLMACASDSNAPPARHALVVVDHEDSREFLRTVLESAGHLCEEAVTAAEAIRKLGAKPFDIVFLDLMLGEGDGITVAEFMRRRKIKTPIVAVSAYLEQMDQETCDRFGIRIRIAKPYRVRDITDAIERST